MGRNTRKRDRKIVRDKVPLQNTNRVKRRRPTHSPEGVDLTLIRWFLTLTPMERLAAVEYHRKAVQQIRDANPEL